MLVRFMRWGTEATVVASSAGFLAWYVWAKVVTQSWTI